MKTMFCRINAVAVKDGVPTISGLCFNSMREFFKATDIMIARGWNPMGWAPDDDGDGVTSCMVIVMDKGSLLKELKSIEVAVEEALKEAEE